MREKRKVTVEPFLPYPDGYLIRDYHTKRMLNVAKTNEELVEIIRRQLLEVMDAKPHNPQRGE